MQILQSLILAALWPLGILAAAAGWGVLLCAALRFPRPGAGLVAAVGTAFLCFIGGILNLLDRVGPIALNGLLLVGWLMVVIAFLRQGLRLVIRNGRDLTLMALGLALAVVGVRGVLAAAETNLNGVDDFQAYYAFSTKILEAGSLGQDVLSQRRIVSSLGSKYFLDAVFLLRGEPSNLLAFDLVFGLSLLLLLTRDVMRSFACPKGAIILALGAVSMTPSLAVNSTADYMAAALLCAAMMVAGAVCWKARDLWGSWLVLGLLLSACLTLRSTLAVPAVFVAGAAVLLACRTLPSWREVALRRTPFLFVSTTVFTLPWMLAMWPVAGTPFYPFLGKGHGYEYGTPPISNLQGLSPENVMQTLYSLAHPNIVLPFAIFGGFLVYGMRKGIFKKSFLQAMFLGAGALLTLGILAVGTGGCDIERYIFPITVAVTPLLFCLLWRTRQAVVLWVSCAALFGAGYAGMTSKTAVLDHLGDITKRTSGWKPYPTEAAETVREIQSKTAEGSTILAHTDYNFLFDFVRNVVLIWDMPGAFGPFGGFPKDPDANALVGYLRRVGIRYIAYSYETRAQFSESQAKQWQGKKYYPWMRRYSSKVLHYHRLLDEIASLHPPVLKTGGMWLIDLDSTGGGSGESAPAVNPAAD